MAKVLKEQEKQIRYADLELDNVLTDKNGEALIRFVKRPGGTTGYFNKPANLSYEEFIWVLTNLLKPTQKKEDKNEFRTFSL